MMGILEYWQALGAPGRGGWPRKSSAADFAFPSVLQRVYS